MLATIAAIATLILLIGYVKIEQRKSQGKPLTASAGKRFISVLIILMILMLAAGIWFAFSVGQTKREQYTLFFIIFAGPVAGLIGLIYAFTHRDKPNK